MRREELCGKQREWGGGWGGFHGEVCERQHVEA